MTSLELARFALYADLGVVFGVPAAVVLTGARGGISILKPLLTGAALIGLPLSIIAYLVTVAEMAGTGLGDLDWKLAGDLVTTTPIGWAFLVRMAALGVAATFCLSAAPKTARSATAGAVALASLAWSGHAAAGEGPMALPRLAADIVHLLAAGAWIGALVLFLALLWAPVATSRDDAAVLGRFAGVGSILVALLVLTGLANLWSLARVGTWRGLLATGYGQLLTIKLGLFIAMLMFAALNRFVLVPALAATGSAGQTRFHLRLSIGLEFCAALAVLAIVARLGLMDPAAA